MESTDDASLVSTPKPHRTKRGAAPAERLLAFGGVVAIGSLVERVALGVP